ncbi:MAG: sugar phosphate isomerase/epimerase [Balneolaceae bacterium]|nr:MAG: sugar phosphate isomerase/epimerase [Balneolaceae bacterium]
MKTLHTFICRLFSVLITAGFLISCDAQTYEQTTANSNSNSNIESPNLNIPEEFKIGGFAVGTQAYTFNRFTVFEAIEKTAEAGGRIIELYPGQRFKPDDDTPMNALSDEQIDELFAKLNENDVMLVNYGVVGLPDPETARQVFEYAQKLGVPAITSNPNTQEEMDFIEELVQEFNIMMAIHNHPRPEDPDSDYMIWDPHHVAGLLDGRDPRLGICADTGHWVRSGISPVEALRLSEGRIISLHLKDVDRMEREGEDVIFGTGLGEVAGVLAELRRQNFAGHISVEYESNWYNNVPDVAQNIGFIRGWSAAQ